MIAGVTTLSTARVNVRQACAALAVSPATWYRHQSDKPQTSKPRPTPARALSGEQRQEVLDTLCEERFVDRSPVHVHATLLSEGCRVARQMRPPAARVAPQPRRSPPTSPTPAA